MVSPLRRWGVHAQPLKSQPTKPFQNDMNFHNSTGLSYEAEAARLAISAGKIETEEWSHEKSKRASRILTKARLSIGSKFPCDA